MRIERIKDVAAVLRGADLFDSPPLEAATGKFLAAPGHHLLFAYDDDGRPVGMISGVEMTHPDKGTETGNEAALATYRRAGAGEEAEFVLLNWDLVENV